MATSKKTASTASSSGKTDMPGFSDMPGLGDIGKMMKQFKVPGIDIAAIMESQKKDMEALAEANRQAYEGIQALARRRNEILMESLTQWQAAMQDATGPDALSKQAERARKGVQKAMADMRELAEMEAASRSKAWKVVQDRFQENLVNLQKLLQPK
ncbi:MAG: TIGR01841 family phasin [Burkholderiaceae bacterium]